MSFYLTYFMATSFPIDLDTLTNPATTDKQNNPSHAAQHANANDAIEAIEAKVGKDGSAVTTSHDYKLSGVTGTDKAVSKTGTETLTGKTLTSPTITNKSATGTDSGAETLENKTLTTPKVDTINEETAANGITVDSLNIKDGKLNTNNSVVTDNITANAISQSAVSDASDASNNSYNNSNAHNPTAGTFKDVDSLTVTLVTTGGDVLVSWSCTYALSATRNVSFRLLADASAEVKQNDEGDGSGRCIAGSWVIKGLSAASHTFKIQATNDSTDVTFTIYDRFISAVELKK